MAFYQLSNEEKEKNRSNLISLWKKVNGVKDKKSNKKFVKKKCRRKRSL